jgi:AcrR family transcriptional regulator
MSEVDDITTNRAPARPRIPQAERSALMKARLCKAAFELIRDHGYVNFRTAAVTKHAGVSQGAHLHHFPTKDSLALATMQYAYDQTTAASLDYIAQLPADAEPVAAMLDDAKHFFLSAHFRVALDILMAGGSDEGFRQHLVNLTVKYRGRVERAWLEKLVDGGWPLAAAEDMLAMTFSLVRGFAMRLLVDPDPDAFERVFERWKLLAGQCRQVLQAPLPPR